MEKIWDQIRPSGLGCTTSSSLPSQGRGPQSLVTYSVPGVSDEGSKEQNKIVCLLQKTESTEWKDNKCFLSISKRQHTHSLRAAFARAADKVIQAVDRLPITSIMNTYLLWASSYTSEFNVINWTSIGYGVVKVCETNVKDIKNTLILITIYAAQLKGIYLITPLCCCFRGKHRVEGWWPKGN